MFRSGADYEDEVRELLVISQNVCCCKKILNQKLMCHDPDIGNQIVNDNNYDVDEDTCLCMIGVNGSLLLMTIRPYL